MLGFVPQPNLRACVPANSSGHWLLASQPPIFLRAGRCAPRKTPLRGVSESQ
jgi:hypothetical protein